MERCTGKPDERVPEQLDAQARQIEEIQFEEFRSLCLRTYSTKPIGGQLQYSEVAQGDSNGDR
jgi:hypothetical protein